MAEPDHISIADIAHSMLETTWDKISAALAMGAIFLPSWHPSLKEASGFASEIAPILGCLWLVVQIVAKLWKLFQFPRR